MNEIIDIYYLYKHFLTVILGCLGGNAYFCTRFFKHIDERFRVMVN